MIPKNVDELVHAKYEEALANGSLKLTESTSKKVKDTKSGMQYLIHYAPALAAKDSSSTKDQSNNEDPFAHPVPELTVLDDLNGTGSYQLLLNKFPVVPEHVLLVTKQFESQSDALSPEDLVATYQLLCKMDDEDENKRHMAFYNSGPASGSSQDHKHLQLFQLPSNFIPLQDKICSGKEHFLSLIHI